MEARIYKDFYINGCDDINKVLEEAEDIVVHYSETYSIDYVCNMDIVMVDNVLNLCQLHYDFSGSGEIIGRTTLATIKKDTELSITEDEDDMHITFRGL